MSEFLPLDTRTGKVRSTSSLAGTAPKPIDFSEVFVTGLEGSGVMMTNAALTQLVNGQSYIDVVFEVPQADNTWIFMECSVVNTTDTNPLNIWPGFTSKLATGFLRQLNGAPNNNNYFLHWAISGLGGSIIEPPPSPDGDTTPPTAPSSLTVTAILGGGGGDTDPPSAPGSLTATALLPAPDPTS